MDRKPPPSNSVRIWMPLYIGDYMADTIGLTNAQHGAYLMSMMAYWRKGEALTSAELREIGGKDVDRICRFYFWENDRWNHKRIDIELAKARRNVQRMKDMAAKSVAKRRSSATNLGST